jgi:hypothetical protein
LRDNVQEGDVASIKGRFKQPLDRIALALQGGNVGCRVGECPCRLLTCRECPVLERGWTGGAVIC